MHWTKTGLGRRPHDLRQATRLRLLDLLAFHYERSENRAKKRDYLQRAGAAAQAEELAATRERNRGFTCSTP